MSLYNIVFLVGIVLAFILTGVLYSSFYGKEKDAHNTIRSMVVDAMFIAIILLMTFVPNLGYLQITPFLSFTLIHIPVLLGAALMGWKKGLLYGTVFGLGSYFQALLSGTGFNALFAFPWTALPPRMAFGLLAGIVFSLSAKLNKKGVKGLYLGLMAAFLTIVHTCLVFLNLYLFYPAEVGGLLTSGDPASTATALTFLALIAIGAAGEAVLAGIAIPPLYAVLRKAVPTMFKN